ncbi:MAG: GNAT family acetyltransferase [Fusobacterium sp.]|nr:GNAT family acetyltransferase [Fusobacterium sp.]
MKKFKEEAEERLNKNLNEVFGKELKLKDLKSVILNFNGDILDDFLVVSSDEEKEFYVKLFELALQEKQKEVIKKGVF